jgi:heme exporter protein D
MNGGAFNWSQFFDMGGYAFYVWWSYGIFFAVIIANIVLPITRRRQVIARVRRAIRRETALQQENE